MARVIPKALLEQRLPLFLGAYNTSYDAAVAGLVTVFRFVTRKQVQEFVFGRADRSSEVMTARILGRNVQRGLITRFAFNGRFVYCAKPPRAGAHVEHDLGVTETILALHRALRVVHVNTNLTFRSVRPDGYVVYETDHYFIHLMIEVDMGTEGSKTVLRKMTRYAGLKRNGVWRDQVDVWPGILIVCPSEKRSLLLKQTLEGHLRGVAVYLTHEELLSEGASEKIFLKIGQEERTELPK